MTIIRRQSEPDGSVFDVEVLNLMRKAYGLTDYVNKGITHDDNFVDNDGKTAMPGSMTIAQKESINLRREGTMLSANGNIKLFNINGKLIRKGASKISLQGLHQGVYIAKSGSQLLKVNIQ